MPTLIHHGERRSPLHLSCVFIGGYDTPCLIDKLTALMQSNSISFLIAPLRNKNTMKRISSMISLLLCSNASLCTFAATSTPPPGPLFTTTTINGATLNITTSTPSWFYQFAGIKVDQPGYTPNNCTPSQNGFCLFPVSDTLSAWITITGQPGTISTILCLDGVGQTASCERHPITITTAANPRLNSLTTIVGDLSNTYFNGNNFIPGLATAPNAPCHLWSAPPNQFATDCTNVILNDSGPFITVNSSTKATFPAVIPAQPICTALCAADFHGQQPPINGSAQCTNTLYSGTGPTPIN